MLLSANEHWQKPKTQLAFYGLLLVFILANCILFTKDIYYLAALPAVIGIFWLSFSYPKTLVLLIAFLTPFSYKETFERAGLSVNLPTEPFIVLLMLFFWMRFTLGGKYDNRVWKQALTIVILVNLFWILVTSLSSSMPLVSFKFFISRLWFITVFYFLGIVVFSNIRNITTFIFVSCLAVCGVVFYTLVNHHAHGWEQLYANFASFPFYHNHGIYAAVLALFLPMLVFFAWERRAIGIPRWQQLFAAFFVLVFIVGTIMSYTRAAWISLAAAAAFLVILRLRIKFRTLLAFALILAGFLWFNRTEIYFKLRGNQQVSSDELEGHLESISNITTDASNTERINRWASAIRMFQEKPLEGFGPGTYMFQYAPYQSPYEKTIISTNAGVRGNAHSEYIGPLAESGLLGLLTFLAIVLISIGLGMRLIYHGKNARVRVLATGITLGLITYYVHGTLNNYLDLDKAAVPFWAFLAMLTALNLYHNRSEEDATVLPGTTPSANGYPND